MTDLLGEAVYTPEAKAKIREWYDDGCPPVPEHSKLEHYKIRRILYLLKLTIVSGVSRLGGLVIDGADVDRALEWLLSAERLMPDIFRHMVGKSDTQTIQELHYFVYREFSKNKKPLHESAIYHFLSQHVPSDKISRVLEIAIRANVIKKLEGVPLYIPRPKNEHGVE